MLSLIAGTSLITLSCRKWCIEKFKSAMFNYVVRKAARGFK